MFVVCRKETRHVTQIRPQPSTTTNTNSSSKQVSVPPHPLPPGTPNTESVAALPPRPFFHAIFPNVVLASELRPADPLPTSENNDGLLPKIGEDMIPPVPLCTVAPTFVQFSGDDTPSLLWSVSQQPSKYPKTHPPQRLSAHRLSFSICDNDRWPLHITHVVEVWVLNSNEYDSRSSLVHTPRPCLSFRTLGQPITGGANSPLRLSDGLISVGLPPLN